MQMKNLKDTKLPTNCLSPLAPFAVILNLFQDLLIHYNRPTNHPPLPQKVSGVVQRLEPH